VKRIVLFAMLLGGTVGAYASDIDVRIYSEPAGAMLNPHLSVGTRPAPLWLKVSMAKDKRQSDPLRPGVYCRQVGPITARWPSGAEATATFTVCDKEGKKRRFFITRPSDMPGVEIDLQVAAQIQRFELERQQMAQQYALESRRLELEDLRRRNAEDARITEDFLKNSPQPRSSRPASEIHCTSEQVGQYVYTNCN